MDQTVQEAVHALVRPEGFAVLAHEGDDGQTYFGVYSMSNGERLTTLKGTKRKCGILRSLPMGDETECGSADLDGNIQFSPDSNTLFTTSEYVQQWDISAFR